MCNDCNGCAKVIIVVKRLLWLCKGYNYCARVIMVMKPLQWLCNSYCTMVVQLLTLAMLRYNSGAATVPIVLELLQWCHICIANAQAFFVCHTSKNVV